MPEVVGAFFSTELRHERADGSVEIGDGPRRKLAQQSLEFAVGHLDRIKVGRVLRQVANCRLRFLDRLADAWDFVGSQLKRHEELAED